MPIYRFLLLENSTTVFGGQFRHCHDDDGANAYADRLARQNCRRPDIKILFRGREVSRKQNEDTRESAGPAA